MDMKNMVVLRNLPSNIIEEAWIVIKPEVKNKEKELIKRMKNNDINNKTSYVLEEAQTVIADYLKNINNYKDKKKYSDIVKKYKKLKRISSILFCIYLIIIIFTLIF